MKLFITCFILFTVIACGKEPMADFEYLPEQPKAGTAVKFINLSKNAKSYSWNFGDMSIGDEENPTHVYTGPGDYIIDLTAHKGLKSDTKTKTLTVFN